MLLLIGLLLYRPSRYKPAEIAAEGQVSKYLTHQLMPQLYDGMQQPGPFEVVIDQDGINDVIAALNWQTDTEGTYFKSPELFFLPDRLILMATVVARKMRFIVTIVAEPAIDQHGFLELPMRKFKIGAINITPVAGIVTGRICKDRFEDRTINVWDIGSQLTAALFCNRPFEPVFGFEDWKVRLEKISVRDKKLTLGLIAVNRGSEVISKAQYRYDF